MKAAVALAALLGTVLLSTPVSAFVAEVTTSVPVAEAADSAQIEQAIQVAVQNVLRDAVAFTPTVMLVTYAVVIRDRLYIRVLVADSDGEAVFGVEPTPERTPEPARVRL